MIIIDIEINKKMMIIEEILMIIENEGKGDKNIESMINLFDNN
jgi:hypothetical protein